MKKRLFIPLALLTTLTACLNPGNVVVEPKPVPTASSGSNPGQGIETLSLLIRDGNNKTALSGASVKITSSSGDTKTATTDQFGTVVFTGLLDNSVYTIEVLAGEYGSRTISTNNAPIIKAGNSSSLTIELFKGLAGLTGKVTNTEGVPVNSALIRVGSSTAALTDANGNFSLNLGNAGSFSITVSKTGFDDFNLGNVEVGKDEIKNLGEIKLSKSNTTPVVIFDNGKSPFGKAASSGSALLSKASALLQNAGYTVRFENVASAALENVEAVFIASPSQAYSDPEIKRLSDFVKSGKKLIITGEWGGFGGFRADSLNKLLAEANLKINPDVVKEVDTGSFQGADDHIVSSTIVPHFVTQGVTRAAFYGTATVEVINGGINQLDTSLTRLIVLSTSNSFRIQVFNRGQFGMGAISTLGAGKIVVFGDSSFITGDDTNNNGVSNLDEANNRQLILNALQW